MPLLSEEQWIEVDAHLPYLAYLKAEWDKPDVRPFTRWVERRLITHPDVNDWSQNHLRGCLLWAIRGALLQRVPMDTKWYEVKYLRREHLGELRVIGRCEWDDPSDKNEVLSVAKRKPLPIDNAVASWESPLLWGHNKAGPFTILEGNHRLTAIAGSASDLPVNWSCYVGISNGTCFWHLADPLTDIAL